MEHRLYYSSQTNYNIQTSKTTNHKILATLNFSEFLVRGILLTQNFNNVEIFNNKKIK